MFSFEYCVHSPAFSITSSAFHCQLPTLHLIFWKPGVLFSTQLSIHYFQTIPFQTPLISIQFSFFFSYGFSNISTIIKKTPVIKNSVGVHTLKYLVSNAPYIRTSLFFLFKINSKQPINVHLAGIFPKAHTQYLLHFYSHSVKSRISCCNRTLMSSAFRPTLHMLIVHKS